MDNIFHKMCLLVIVAVAISSLATELLDSVWAQNLSKLEQALKGTKENATLENMTGGAIGNTSMAAGNMTGGNATMPASNVTIGDNATGQN
jgi:hypothetical protein